jgi:hypothetical protein
MAINVSKIFNARVYIDGNDFIAKAEEVELPKVKFKFADSKGLGLYGEFELPSGLDKMEAKIKFNSMYPDFLKIASDPTKTRTVIVRASNQYWTNQGVMAELPVKAEMRGFFKEFDSGKFKKADNTEAEATLSVIYYKLEVDEQEIVEVDVINNIYKVAGNDILQQYKINIGG